MQGFLWQPHIGAIDLCRLFTRKHFHPVNFFLAAVGFGNGGINHFQHHRRNIHTRAIALDKRNDGLIRHIQRVVGIDSDFLALGGHLDVLIHVQKSPVSVDSALCETR